MSFYSYKNANSEYCPGEISANSVLTGLNKRVCIQVKNVYDSALSQEQLNDKEVVIQNIVPVLPSSSCGSASAPAGRSCICNGNTCVCAGANQPITHAEAVENAENSTCPLPTPYGNWTFESCRSSTTAGAISNLSIERLCDRPQYGRVRCSVEVPVDVLFVDQRCQEWMGQASITVDKDVLLCIPDDSVIPFTLESLVSAICVSGSYKGNCTFEITICVTVVLKVLAEVDILVPTYGFCEVPPAEEFAENVCDEFFSLPLFPQSSCAFENVGSMAGSGVAGTNGAAGSGTASAAMGGCYTCGTAAPAATATASTCSNCGTTCLSGSSLCPRCGCAMTSIS